MDQRQDGEGQSSGTTVTVANSGVAPSTAYTTVNTVAAGTIIYDNSKFAHGSQSIKVATGATAGTVNGLQTFTAVPTVWGRFYINSTDWTSSMNFGTRLRGSSVQAMRINFDSTGHIIFRNTANTSIVTGAVALSNATWYRIEFTCTPGTTTTGAATANVYLGDATITTDSITTSTANFGINQIDEFGMGLFTSTANVSAFWYDDTDINDSAFPGPAFFELNEPVLLNNSVMRASFY